jgi:hypothetical protein
MRLLPPLALDTFCLVDSKQPIWTQPNRPYFIHPPPSLLTGHHTSPSSGIWFGG